MDIKNLIRLAGNMQTAEDLLGVLNAIKKDELGDKAFPYNIYQLHLYCNPNHTEGRYHEFQIPKKHGNGVRVIDAPNNGLKALQRDVKVLLEALYTPSYNVMGFVTGKSVVDNARRHLHQNYILNLDLKDFFPSISQPRVWARLKLPPFNFQPKIASLIAGICSIKKTVNKDGVKTTVYVLPQGAPTSPILSNAVCEKLDRRLRGLAKRFRVNYTRYADDITFSGMRNVFKEDGFKVELERIIEDQNFHINRSKTRIQVAGNHQEVTGLTVGEKVNVSKKYVKSIRSLLYIWMKYGYNEAYKKYFNLYVKRRLTRKNQNVIPPMESYLNGKLNYLKMVKGSDDTVYKRLCNLYLWLNSGGADSAGTLPPDIKPIRSWSVEEFEKLYSSDIVSVKSRNGHLYWAYSFNSRMYPISCDKAIREDTDKKQVRIFQCQRSSGYTFYLARLVNADKKELIRNLTTEQLDKTLDIWEDKEKGINVSRKYFLSCLDSSKDINNLSFVSKLSGVSTLTDKQRSRLQKLMLAALSSGDLSSKVESKTPVDNVRKECDYHDPKAVQRFMQSFSKNDALKYTVHVWEKNQDGDFTWSNFKDFYDSYYKELFSASEDSINLSSLYNYNYSLHNTIYNFLLPHSSEKKEKERNWDAKNKISVGYCYPNGVVENWMNSNPGKQPYAMPLTEFPKEVRPNIRIGGKNLVYFEDLVNVFKHIIRLDDDELYYLIKSIFRGADYVVDEKELETLKGYTFYTHVHQLSEALRIIQTNISCRTKFNHVCIKAENDKLKNQLKLSITQLGSFSDKGIDDPKITLVDSKSQLADIKRFLKSLCDFSVISRFRDEGGLGTYQVDYLYDKDFNVGPRFNKLKNVDAVGFTYLLNFYL